MRQAIQIAQTNAAKVINTFISQSSSEHTHTHTHRTHLIHIRLKEKGESEFTHSLSSSEGCLPIIDYWANTLLEEGCQCLNILLLSSHTQSPLIVSVCLPRVWGHRLHHKAQALCVAALCGWGRKFSLKRNFLGMKNSMKIIFLSKRYFNVK